MAGICGSIVAIVIYTLDLHNQTAGAVQQTADRLASRGRRVAVKAQFVHAQNGRLEIGELAVKRHANVPIHFC